MQNEGTADRMLRLALGAIVLAVALFGFGVGSALGVIACVIAAVLLITGIVGFCPAYRLIGIRTCTVQTRSA